MSAQPQRQRVTVNGRPEHVPIGVTLEDVLQWENLSLSYSPDATVRLNGERVDRVAWKDHQIHDGDRIEVEASDADAERDDA